MPFRSGLSGTEIHLFSIVGGKEDDVKPDMVMKKENISILCNRRKDHAAIKKQGSVKSRGQVMVNILRTYCEIPMSSQ